MKLGVLYPCRYDFVSVQSKPKIKFDEKHGGVRIVIDGFQFLIPTGDMTALIEVLR